MVLFMELNIQIDSLFPSLELGGPGTATATTPYHHTTTHRVRNCPSKQQSPSLLPANLSQSPVMPGVEPPAAPNHIPSVPLKPRNLQLGK